MSRAQRGAPEVEVEEADQIGRGPYTSIGRSGSVIQSDQEPM